MKKIISWIASSFFRQFGRFLFFLVLGFLFVLLLQHNEINLKQFRWTDLLGIDTVYALDDDIHTEDMKNSFLNDCSYFIDGGQSVSITSCGWDNNFRTATISTNDSSGHGTIRFNSSNLVTAPTYVIDSYHRLMPSKIQFQARIDYTSIWSFDEIYIENSTGSGASYTPANSYDNGISLNFFPVFSNGVTSTGAGGGLCSTNYSNNDGSYKYYTITCNVPGSAYGINELRVSFYYNRTTTQSYQTSLDVGISTNFNWLYTGIIDAKNYVNQNTITESVTEIQTQQNETISILNDTNSTADINSTTSFFNDTNITVENSLTSIVSSPINMINNLVVGNYNSICATLNGKQICLPSGSIIWQRSSSVQSHGGSGVHDNYHHWFSGGTVENFISFFNLVVGGYILYRCLISLFYSIHKALDPADTYIEVMKL